MRRFELTDPEWGRLNAHLPKSKQGAGRPALDDRLFVNALIWIARTGWPWRDLPERFGPWERSYRRFSRWAKRGHWQAIFEAVQDPGLEWTMLDSTTVKARNASAGQKKVLARDQRP